MFPDDYRGPLLDWPDYRPLNEQDSPELVRHVRHEYAALLAMCDKIWAMSAGRYGQNMACGRTHYLL